LTHGGDVREDGYVVALGKKEFKHPALGRTFHFKGGLVGFDGGDGLARPSPRRRHVTFQVVKMQLSTD
jgi:hypothetical protein